MLNKKIHVWEMAQRGAPHLLFRIHLFDGASFLCTHISATADKDGDVWITLQNPQPGQCRNMDGGSDWFGGDVAELKTLAIAKRAIAGIKIEPIA